MKNWLVSSLNCDFKPIKESNHFGNKNAGRYRYALKLKNSVAFKRNGLSTSRMDSILVANATRAMTSIVRQPKIRFMSIVGSTWISSDKYSMVWSTHSSMFWHIGLSLDVVNDGDMMLRTRLHVVSVAKNKFKLTIS